MSGDSRTVEELLATPEHALPTIPRNQAPAVIGRLEAAKVALWLQSTATATAAPDTGCRYVTQTEAAERFGIPLADVRYLTRRGIVPAVGRGRNKRLLPADLERHLGRCAREGLAIRCNTSRIIHA